MQLCKLPRFEHVQRFIADAEETAIRKVIRRCIASKEPNATGPDAATVLETLQQQNASQPGSVAVRVSPLERTVILLGRDLLTTSSGDIQPSGERP